MITIIQGEHVLFGQEGARGRKGAREGRRSGRGRREGGNISEEGDILVYIHYTYILKRRAKGQKISLFSTAILK